MPKALDLSGQRFDRLVVLELDEIKRNSNGKTIRYWKCICDCGKTVTVSTQNLRQGNTKSCGCLKKAFVSQINYKHGKKGTRLYNVWKDMKKRCYYSKASNYKYYGGRNITICDEWLGEYGFENFSLWALANGYSDELTIDRIDSNKNYCPENCRWITIAEQQKNRRNNVLYYYDGKKLSAREWSEITGIDLGVLLNRLYSLGWNVERALTEPIHNN
jgi:hypothetical protein